MTHLLDRIHSPADLRQLDDAQLPEAAEELRAHLLASLSETG
ncbi:MAG: 1-deoxy-D-xylulose-5-phosphate synthase N-terminal domain-containing protein, partial [Thiohalorhabdaceae bacterium]